jgi:hypothetical protein
VGSPLIHIEGLGTKGANSFGEKKVTPSMTIEGVDGNSRNKNMFCVNFTKCVDGYQGDWRELLRCIRGVDGNSSDVH